MVLRNYPVLYFAVMAFLCLRQIKVDADNCECACHGISPNNNLMCPFYRQLKNERKNISDQITDRTQYINELKKMSMEVDRQYESILRLTPEPSNLIFEDEKQDHADKNQLDIQNIEEEINDITTFLKELDVEGVFHSKIKTLRDSLLENEIRELRNKLDGVIYKDDTNNLSERLDSMENELSVLIDSDLVSQILKAIERFQLDLDSLNRTAYENIQSGQSHQSKMEKHNTVIKDVGDLKSRAEYLNNTTSVFRYEFSEMGIDIRGLGKKVKIMETELGNIVIQSFKNEIKKTVNQLKKFKADWISNCTRGLMPCFLLPNNPHSPGFDLNNDERPLMDGPILGEDCAPIYEKDYPFLQITRIDDATLRLRCTEGMRLVGPMHIRCINGQWNPDIPPKCISMF